MCHVGFSPTKEQIKDIVEEYVQLHELSTPFKNDHPGRDWIRHFMNRNKLSLKKATMTSTARKSAMGNPFIVYNFFNVIEDIINNHNIPPSNIWNCDESGFTHDPSECLVISVKGEVAYKVTYGPGQENTTTLAVASATGRVLDPLIIFTRKNFQSTWKGSNALPKTFYAVLESGWMTTEISTVWFNLFRHVTERPLLLIFDGHLTHILAAIYEKAIHEGIHIVKLLPHVTDKLQTDKLT